MESLHPSSALMRMSSIDESSQSRSVGLAVRKAQLRHVSMVCLHEGGGEWSGCMV